MNEMTAGEQWARGEALESEAATLLGKMLFEFSRLDVNLGLCLVWVDGGSNLASLTKTVGTYNLNTKLDELAKLVDIKLPPGSKRHKAYKAWLERTHKVRQQRNELVHGRWGVDAPNNQVINILGLPTSDAQREIRYSIEELAAINDELRQLQQELSRLRTHWPL
jgi:hypothetical protein